MATFLPTKSIAAGIDTLIRTAERDLVLVSPFVNVSDHFLTRLEQAQRNGVSITLVYGKRALTAEERGKLGRLKGLALYYLEHLHAKCYANERELIIGSMNLYEYSELNNWEMGVLLTETDGEAIKQARAEIRQIIHNAKPESRGGIGDAIASIFRIRGSAPRGVPALRTQTEARKAGGYCIRCSEAIRYSPWSPLCDRCYSSWAAWQNDDYPEQRCHRCGEPADVTKARPLCYDCFREAPFSPRRVGGI